MLWLKPGGSNSYIGQDGEAAFKWVSFSAFKYMKGEGFHKLWYMKGGVVKSSIYI